MANIKYLVQPTILGESSLFKHITVKKKLSVFIVALFVISFATGTYFSYDQGYAHGYIQGLAEAGGTPTIDGAEGISDMPWVNATAANFEEFYLNSEDKTDLLAHPELSFTYIIFIEGSTIRARNGETGIIDYSGTDALTVIQSAKDSCTPHDTIFIKNGIYDFGTKSLDATGINLVGESYFSTNINYNGSGYAITYNGTEAQQQYYFTKNLRINLGTNPLANGLRLVDRCFYFNLKDLLIVGSSKVSQVGLLLHSGPTGGVYWNIINNFRTLNIGIGILLNGTGVHRANANTFISPIIRSTPTNGIGIHILQGRTTKMVAPHIESSNSVVGILIQDNYTDIIAPTFELNGGDSVCINLTSEVDNCFISGGRINTAGQTVVNSGTNVKIIGLKNYVTENKGIATILNSQTSITVSHGCDYTPSAGDISVHPIESLGSASFFWVDTITASQFTIHLNADSGQDVDFAWSVDWH